MYERAKNRSTQRTLQGVGVNQVNRLGDPGTDTDRTDVTQDLGQLSRQTHYVVLEQNTQHLHHSETPTCMSDMSDVEVFDSDEMTSQSY